MKAFKELIITGNSDSSLINVLDRLKQYECTNWKVRQDLIDNYSKNTGKSKDEIICLESNNILKKNAIVWFGFWENSLRVMNIVPTEVGSLNHEEYNTLIDKFYQDCLDGILNNFEYKLKLSRDNIDIEEVAGTESAQLLKRWEHFCNRTTGNTNSNDFKRWAEFLSNVHKTKSELTPEWLERWLIEARGWEEESDLLHKIVHDYEYGLHLLEIYDEFNKSE